MRKANFYFWFQGYEGYFSIILFAKHGFYLTFIKYELKKSFEYIIVMIFKYFIMRGVFFRCNKIAIWYNPT